MFPVRDTTPSRNAPIVNWLIIAVNIIVFLYEVSLSDHTLEQLLTTLGLVPARFAHHFGVGQMLTVFSSMFLHGGFAHIIGNMWFLHIFGDNVEDRMGHLRYLVFYLVSGVAAAMLQVAVAPQANVPMIGASGAIAGILGAYWRFFPNATVITMVPTFVVPSFIEVKAVFYLAFWFVFQFLTGMLALGGAQSGHLEGGVAWWAHIGGFIVGLILAQVFARQRKQRPWYPDEYFPW
ncbi:MAG: rhomboid family intramembrane serine protease [Candidatus Melainabacteria bacterium]|nr:rhomboid family intramembrane serine protease [Candidatus Melainabacteria bacterium]